MIALIYLILLVLSSPIIIAVAMNREVIKYDQTRAVDIKGYMPKYCPTRIRVKRVENKTTAEAPAEKPVENLKKPLTEWVADNVDFLFEKLEDSDLDQFVIPEKTTDNIDTDSLQNWLYEQPRVESAIYINGTGMIVNLMPGGV